MNKFIFIIFSISLTVLMTISCTDNDTNTNPSIEKQYITIEEFDNQLKLDEEKYQALLNYVNVLEEKIISPSLITIDLFTGALNSLNSFKPTHFVFFIIKSTSISF